ncbi:MAG TPA: SRPBCC family protein [Kofleriaceae bacterium]|nr:SRPBCC family protein [Kofleriaceae bacterium]
MHRDLQAALVRRVLAHLEQRTTDAEAAPSTVPVAAYADPARLERERARLFRDLPLAIGHASQLPAPGDFITHDATGAPLLVVRTDDGAVAAYLNVCRHRGTRVEAAPCGQRKAFVCPYHAWSYGRDGRLLGVPHEDGFAGLDRDARGLVRVPAGVAAGFVFVRPRPPAPGEALDLGPELAAWLGPLAADLDGFGCATSHVYDPRTQARALSWKLAIDVFLESYHLRTTHRSTIYGMFFDNLGLVDPVGPHTRNVFPKRSIRELAALPDLAARPESEWSLRRHANVLFHLFPNTLILVQPDHAAVLHLWPDGPARAVLTSYTLVLEPPATDKARAYWDANNKILYDAIAEDFQMGESIQRGLASGANQELVFGAFEHALAHFHRQIELHAAT